MKKPPARPSPHPLLPLDQILAGDCVQVMAGLPAESVDLVFADPPYNLQLRQPLWRPNLTRVAAVTDDWDQFTSFSEYDAFTRAWLTACRRVLKPGGALWVIGTYHNIYRIGAAMQDIGYWILNDILWVKTNPMPNFRGVRFTNAHETLIWASTAKGAKYTFNHHAMKAVNDDLQMRSDWVIPLCGGEERIRENGKKAHSTQKPEALLYRVLLASSHPGDVVLDPFFGSGTTGAVAKKLNRRWIGIEKEEKYIRIARQRIDSLPAQPDDSALEVRSAKTSAPRIPFGALLENGLLSPGQALYFQRNPAVPARIKANGHLVLPGFEGSIHQAASHLLNGSPCNGWEHWFYQSDDGAIHPIDDLREQIRNGVP